MTSINFRSITRISIKLKWTPLFGCMQAIHQFTVGRYVLQILTLELVNGLFFQWFCLETEGNTYEKLRNIFRCST